jgi:hypothetical protein
MLRSGVAVESVVEELVLGIEVVQDYIRVALIARCKDGQFE